ncbi:MAG: hypothetical protein DMF72_05095 [Acidobacteria bacterium]|nr:MAG: hypothetical protein DMF72_05095 [Acidobacteriota bacterium]
MQLLRSHRLLVCSQDSFFAKMNQFWNRRTIWPALLIVAGAPRIVGAFFLPNAFGDAYVYIRDIGTLSTKISTGSLRLTDLFGFWLPLYQFLSAIVNVLIKNGFYSGKLVAALFGAGTCLFVYAITLRLTADRRAALAMFLLIALNPLHIFYSASAMTDVPHAFLVVAVLYFILSGNWIVAAIFGALAGLTRVESWMLIALIPCLQLIRDRRVSLVAIVILILPPVFWFYISWKATGDAFACFKQRQEYHDWLMTMNPSIARFSLKQIMSDTATLLVSTDIAVLVACCVAAWFVLRSLSHPAIRERGVFSSLGLRVRQTKSEVSEVQSILAPLLFFFAFLALLIGAYLTHQQPIIFPRYGLILFTLGLPILAWTYLWIRKHKPQIARRVLVAIIVICSFDATIQFAGAVGEINRYKTQRNVADYLRDHFDQNSNTRIFCDDGTVRVLSGISEDKFLSSADAPRERESFLKFLNDQKVEYLVVIEAERSTPFDLYRSAAEYNESIGNYESIMHAHSEFLRTNIHVYRLRK